MKTALRLKKIFKMLRKIKERKIKKIRSILGNVHVDYNNES